jgi:hypothetical protein
MSFTALDGARTEKPFIVDGAEPAGKAQWNGPQRPNSEWRLLRGGHTPFSATFENSQIERTYLNWTAKSRPGVTFGLWSPERSLAAGESIRLNANYTTPHASAPKLK